MMTLAKAFAALALAASPDFTKVSETDGITVESRPVEGSKIVELRLTTLSKKDPQSLCDVAFGTGKFDPDEPDLKSRKIISESADERVTYEQISPAVVANRDYAVRAKRKRLGPDACVMTFEAANDVAPKAPDGWVRIEKLHGEWRFEKQPDAQTKVTYVIFSDPAGSIPTFMVEGSRKTIAVRWVKMLVSRAK